MERSEETDNSVITSAVIRGTGRGFPIRICGLLGGSVQLIGNRNVSKLCLLAVSSVSFYLTLVNLVSFFVIFHFVPLVCLVSSYLLKDQRTCKSLHINRCPSAVSSGLELSPFILSHFVLTLICFLTPCVLKFCFSHTVSEENKDQCCILIDKLSFCCFIMFQFFPQI